MNTEHLRQSTRRHFLGQAGVGLGSIALSSLLARETSGAPAGAAPSGPHFPPRVKNVIYLFMAGAPSQLDLFDPKPALDRYHDTAAPKELLAGEQFAFIKGVPNLLASPYKFAKFG